jgi:hypothetical protein
MKQRRDFLKWAAAVMLLSAAGLQAAEGNVNDLPGGWITYHSSPTGPFKELLTFADGGALTETNTLLHTASNLGFFAAFGLPPGLNASDGRGTWTRIGPAQAQIEFRKLMFGQGGAYFGDFWVKGVATLSRAGLHIDWSQVLIVDPNDHPLLDLIQVLGPSSSDGTKIGSSTSAQAASRR